MRLLACARTAFKRESAEYKYASAMLFKRREEDMPYQAAVIKAWEDLERLSENIRYTVALLGDTYDINVKERRVFSNSCNVPAKDYVAILLLHYLIGTSKNKYIPSGEWISFKEISGGEAYYPAFREGVIEPILRKYGSHPENLYSVAGRFKGEKIESTGMGIEIVIFPEVKVRIIIWPGDEEFGPEASMLFDKSLIRIYTMEDITVLSNFIAGSL